MGMRQTGDLSSEFETLIVDIVYLDCHMKVGARRATEPK